MLLKLNLQSFKARGALIFIYFNTVLAAYSKTVSVAEPFLVKARRGLCTRVERKQKVYESRIWI